MYIVSNTVAPQHSPCQKYTFYCWHLSPNGWVLPEKTKFQMISSRTPLGYSRSTQLCCPLETSPCSLWSKPPDLFHLRRQIPPLGIFDSNFFFHLGSRAPWTELSSWLWVLLKIFCFRVSFSVFFFEGLSLLDRLAYKILQRLSQNIFFSAWAPSFSYWALFLLATFLTFSISPTPLRL